MLDGGVVTSRKPGSAGSAGRWCSGRWWPGRRAGWRSCGDHAQVAEVQLALRPRLAVRDPHRRRRGTAIPAAFRAEPVQPPVRHRDAHYWQPRWYDLRCRNPLRSHDQQATTSPLARAHSRSAGFGRTPALPGHWPPEGPTRRPGRRQTDVPGVRFPLPESPAADTKLLGSSVRKMIQDTVVKLLLFLTKVGVGESRSTDTRLRGDDEVTGDAAHQGTRAQS